MTAIQEDISRREPLVYRLLRNARLDKEPPKVEVGRLYDISQQARHRCPIQPTSINLDTWGYTRKDYLESPILSDSDWMMKTVATDQLTSFYEEWDLNEDGGLRRNFMQAAVNFVFDIRKFANPNQIEALQVMQDMKTKVREMKAKNACVNMEGRLILEPEEIIMLAMLAYPERLVGKGGDHAYIFLEDLRQGSGTYNPGPAETGAFNLSFLEKRLNARVAQMAAGIFGSRKSLREIIQRGQT